MKTGRDRILKQHDAGTNVPQKLRGWYDMVGGGAGGRDEGRVRIAGVGDAAERRVGGAAPASSRE
jgi:hypothetical protein